MKKKSWKTTTAAVIGVATVVLAQLGAMWDSDPATVANWNAVTPVLAACVGLFFSKDDSKEA
jgi:hypothetical protein